MEIYRDKLIELLNLIPDEFPIISSIGKQSRGKSSFLGYFFDDPSIPNKCNQNIIKGTDVAHCSIYKTFALLDIEGIESLENSRQRDILNFCTAIAVSDMILLNISQSDMENPRFITDFAFTYFQSTKISSKYKLEAPSIVLLIRDPRWKMQKEENSKSYELLVKGFQHKVNDIIQEYSSQTIDMYEEIVQNASGQEKENCLTLLREADDMSKRIVFTIETYTCVYFHVDFKNSEVKYFDTIDGETSEKQQSQFFSLRNFIERNIEKYQKSYEDLILSKTMPILDESNDMTLILNSIVLRSILMKLRGKVVLGIYWDVKYDILLRSANPDQFFRIIEKYFIVKASVDKICSKVNRNFNGTISYEMIEECRKEHEISLGGLYEKEKEKIDTEIMMIAIEYAKYLSAEQYVSTFAISPSDKCSFVFQCLNLAVYFPSEHSQNLKNIKDLETNMKKFSCLCYADLEFKYMVHSFMSLKFLLYPSLFDIFSRIIENSLSHELIYKEAGDNMIPELRKENPLASVQLLLSVYNPYFIYDSIELEEFINTFIDFHDCLLQKKISTSPSIPRNIYSFTFSSKSVFVQDQAIINGLLPNTYKLCLNATKYVVFKEIIPEILKIPKLIITGLSAFSIPFMGLLTNYIEIGINELWKYKKISMNKKSARFALTTCVKKGFKIVHCSVYRKKMNAIVEDEVFAWSKKKFKCRACVSIRRGTNNVAAYRVIVLIISTKI